MKFKLIYDGELLSSSNKPHHDNKMDIRRKLHPQLVKLWQVHPVLQHIQPPTPVQTVGNWRCVPLVTRHMDLVCTLEVLMFRDKDAGSIIRGDGDIDNRLTTLFDALRMPHVPQELADQEPMPDQEPFFCLLEDDALITRVSVDTERLLVPVSTAAEVKLIMGVTVRATKLTGDNRLFVSYDRT